MFLFRLVLLASPLLFSSPLMSGIMTVDVPQIPTIKHRLGIVGSIVGRKAWLIYHFLKPWARAFYLRTGSIIVVVKYAHQLAAYGSVGKLGHWLPLSNLQKCLYAGGSGGQLDSPRDYGFVQCVWKAGRGTRLQYIPPTQGEKQGCQWVHVEAMR